MFPYVNYHLSGSLLSGQGPSGHMPRIRVVGWSNATIIVNSVPDRQVVVVAPRDYNFIDLKVIFAMKHLKFGWNTFFFFCFVAKLP